MSEDIEFTRNYSDLCTDKGFQFEFHCDRCGNGHRTHFKPSATGTIASALDVASGLLGGVLSRAADATGRVHSAAWERAHDKHFQEAVEEAMPFFAQCPHCQAWVCRKRCWNEDRGLCKSCAPDTAVEMSAAQAERTREAIWENAAVAEDDREAIAPKQFRTQRRALCPQCEAPLQPGAKFCAECGAKIEAQAFCSECGAELRPGAKFCAECGTKVE